MGRDAFSQYHPLTNFLFFVGAIGFCVVFQHPAYLAVGMENGRSESEYRPRQDSLNSWGRFGE